MPCGFDIKRSKEEILKANIDYSSNLKDKKTYVVDGNKYFNRPGPDLLESILNLKLHPKPPYLGFLRILAEIIF